jgi:predicted ATPase
MAALSYRSCALWFLGYPEAALADRDQTLIDAREIGQAGTLLHALSVTSLPLIHCGNYATASAQLDELTALADEKGTLFWKVAGMLDRGCLLASIGGASNAVHMITSGITARRSTGSALFEPFYLSCLTRAHVELGQFDDAWHCIGEAMKAVEKTKETLFEAEVNRIAGEVALMSPEPDAAKAEAYFERALAVARSSKQNPGNCARR